MSKNSGNIYAAKELFKRIKKYKYRLILSLAFSMGYVALSLYIPKLIGKATDKIVSKGNVDYRGLRDIAIKILIAALLGGIFQFLSGLINNKVAFSVTKDIRIQAFSRVLKMPMGYLDRVSSGKIVSNVIADVDQLTEGLIMGFSNVFSGIVTIIATLIFMLQIDFKIAIVVIVLTPMSLFISGFISKRTFSMFSKQSGIRGEITSLIEETVRGEKVIQAFNQQKEMNAKFDGINKRLRDCYKKATFSSSLTNPVTRLVNNTVYAAVTISGAMVAIILKGVTPGELTTILMYANQYSKPFNDISGVIAEMQNALACAQTVFKLIEQEVEVDSDDAKVLADAKGNVKLKDVEFSYNKDIKMIENLNLDVKKGQHIALVGPTGCGKTTIINLLMRFYDVDKGEIILEDYNIKDLTRKSLRDSYGMVLQDTWLRNATVAENIAMAKLDATREEIIEAAKKSHAHSFIKRLPNGYDTVLVEEGSNISQGQKQLLCIARVMLKLPNILILDEATSSIDTRTEIRIQKAFKKMMKNRTTFIVAHRLSTIKDSDIILVMKDGHIIETGNHEELLKNKGFYYNLYNSQF